MILPMTTSSTPLVQAVVHPQAIGTMFPLTQQVRWGGTLQSPLIPTIMSTFPTLIPPIKTSSMPPVQAAVQSQAIGTMFPLTQQVMSEVTLPSP